MDSYVGEIRMFLGSYAPRGWHLCDGSTLPINGNEALFSLLGTVWGGDGRTNFGLPDYRGRVPVGQGQGTGLQNRILAQTGGTETVTILASQVPAHTHTFNVANLPANQTTPGASLMLGTPVGGDAMYIPSTVTPANSPVPADNTLLPIGDNLPHANIMPSFPLSFIICLLGTYPEKP